VWARTNKTVWSVVQTRPFALTSSLCLCRFSCQNNCIFRLLSYVYYYFVCVEIFFGTNEEEKNRQPEKLILAI